MYPKFMPDIMILPEAVLQIFCSQCCFTTQNAKGVKGRVFSQIFTEFCQKLIRSSTPWTQTLMLNIMILAQAILQIFCSQGPLWVKRLSEKGNNSVRFRPNFMKSLSVDLHHVSKMYA